MTSSDFRAELEKAPFVPFRIHLVSGNSLDVMSAGNAWMLQNAVLILHPLSPNDPDTGYDMVSLRNIERLEQMKGGNFNPVAILSRSR